MAVKLRFFFFPLGQGGCIRRLLVLELRELLKDPRGRFLSHHLHHVTKTFSCTDLTPTANPSDCHCKNDFHTGHVSQSEYYYLTSVKA